MGWPPGDVIKQINYNIKIQKQNRPTEMLHG